MSSWRVVQMQAFVWRSIVRRVQFVYHQLTQEMLISRSNRCICRTIRCQTEICFPSIISEALRNIGNRFGSFLYYWPAEWLNWADFGSNSESFSELQHAVFLLYDDFVVNKLYFQLYTRIRYEYLNFDWKQFISVRCLTMIHFNSW